MATVSWHNMVTIKYNNAVITDTGSDNEEAFALGTDLQLSTTSANIAPFDPSVNANYGEALATWTVDKDGDKIDAGQKFTLGEGVVFNVSDDIQLVEGQSFAIKKGETMTGLDTEDEGMSIIEMPVNGVYVIGATPYDASTTASNGGKTLVAAVKVEVGAKVSSLAYFDDTFNVTGGYAPITGAAGSTIYVLTGTSLQATNTTGGIITVTTDGSTLLDGVSGNKTKNAIFTVSSDAPVVEIA